MKFLKSNGMKISLTDEDRKWLSSDKRIKEALQDKEVIPFDIYENNQLIGFVMLRQWDKQRFFLWDFAIDASYQNKGYGSKAIKELFQYLKDHYQATLITTTYIFGNERAKYVYEKLGFRQTSIVEEDGIHEVNMVLEL